eukprot:4139000-Alexandrium_andersonii.AAC.1
MEVRGSPLNSMRPVCECMAPLASTDTRMHARAGTRTRTPTHTATTHRHTDAPTHRNTDTQIQDTHFVHGTTACAQEHKCIHDGQRPRGRCAACIMCAATNEQQHTARTTHLAQPACRKQHHRAAETACS